MRVIQNESEGARLKRVESARKASAKLRANPAWVARKQAKERARYAGRSEEWRDTRNEKIRRKIANDPEVKKRYADTQKRAYRAMRLAILVAYGERCACCFETEPLFLELDHVLGGGNAHKRIRWTWGVYRDVIDAGFPPEYRLLCANCNRGRWRNGGECPHRANRS